VRELRRALALLGCLALAACQGVPSRTTVPPHADAGSGAAHGAPKASEADAGSTPDAGGARATAAAAAPSASDAPVKPAANGTIAPAPAPVLPGLTLPAAASPRLPQPQPPERDVWQRLREGFMLPGCDYAPGTEDWARRYAASPRRFSAALSEMLPALDYTQRRMEQARLPSEFALLPIVESHFFPHAGPANRPAGIWQMIGPTARSAGVRMDGWFDGRLNLADSTDAAVALLDRYAEHFNEDWRLVSFAYNAGEFRIKRALRSHQPGEDFGSLRGLGIADSSLDYLTKLLALSCLIREPERFDLELPALAPERTLAEVELDGVIGMTLARAISGLSEQDFERVNAGALRGRTPPGASHRLLVSAQATDRSEALDEIPPALRTDWQRRTLRASESLDEIASRNGMLLETLLAVNGRAAEAKPAPGARLWLPGRSGSAAAQDTAPQAGDAGADDAATPGVHVVHRGDSLWSIARRYRLTVAELLRYNRLPHERLLPGQRLRLRPP
jgi:membrane-bound lytic murein transglycosylase D